MKVLSCLLSLFGFTLPLGVVSITLNQQSGIVTYNGVPGSQMWSIIPSNPPASSIQFIFNSFSMGFAELVITESGSSNSIFQCSGTCGSIPPPNFYSSGGNVQISVSGAAVSTSFTLHYIAQPSVSTRVPELNNTIVTLTMGYAKIRPQLFNSMLPAKYKQQWFINPTSMNGNKLITFSFASFSFSSVCTPGSSLSIYDNVRNGTRIFYGCKDSDYPSYWLYSTTGQAYVVLTGSTMYNTTLNFELVYVMDTDLYGCGSVVVTDVQSAKSMILSDGSASGTRVRLNSKCQWLLQPLAAQSVTLVMGWLSLGNGASVTVYDGSSLSSPTLFSMIGPTRVVPPLLTSSAGAMFIAFNTNGVGSDNTGYKGFRGSYQSNFVGSVGVGSGYVVLAMSSVLDISHPGNGTACTRSINYTWFVQPQQSTGPLTFAFNKLDLGPCRTQLVFYDGPVVSSAKVISRISSRTALPSSWIITRSRNATLRLFSSASQGGSPSSTPASGDYSGFSLSYFTDGPNQRCGFATNPAVLTAPSMVITEGSSAAQTIYSGLTCQWTLAPALNSSKVFLYFKRFDMTGATISVYSGPVRSGNLLMTITGGSSPPSPLLVSSPTVGISYSSGSSVSGTGFALAYYGISKLFLGPGDGVVQLASSVVVSLTSGYTRGTPSSAALQRRNITWLIKPIAAVGPIYISLGALSLGTQSSLSIYDGSTGSAPLLALYTGSQMPQYLRWVQTSAPVALLRYSIGSSPVLGDFDLSYYSDGPTNHCGFSTNPARFSAPSMVFSDGSISSASMFANQDCSWVIQPNPETVASSLTVVLEILSVDMTGGTIRVYDGSSGGGDLLWQCSGCRTPPRPIISSGSSLFIRFSSGSGSTMGKGFRAIYWSLESRSGSNWRDYANGTVLELPASVKSMSAQNFSWILGISSTSTSLLSLYPRVEAADVHAIDGASFNDTLRYRDGRGSAFSSSAALSGGLLVCGSLLGGGSSVLADAAQSFKMQATQQAASYVSGDAFTKSVSSLAGSWGSSPQLASIVNASLPNVCFYRLVSGSTKSINIKIVRVASGSGGARLRIFGGMTGLQTDQVLFDSVSGIMTTTVAAPCGLASILAETGSTATLGFRIEYIINADDSTLCSLYTNSLNQASTMPLPWPLIYGAVGAGAVLFVLLVLAHRYRHRIKDYFDPDRPQYKIVNPHPKYTPILDKIQNRFLPTGTCCVCGEKPVKIFQLSCKHGVCVEDMNSYFSSALGNISLFPLKCPMHYEGCVELYDSKMAKRVLTRLQYDRFLEFSDRAVFGEGMRCIFCNNFVNFPSFARALVECPYCIQRFCIRCKKPWHYGGKCPLDVVDDSLEEWKKDSGAMKCPTCHKLIEKEDNATQCNHMVHKITDGDPCVRDRTDFCYLCGEEVLPDYPHDEVRNPGVNHFPEGVFQKCRLVLQKEREEELRRQQRLRRTRKFVPPRLLSSFTFGRSGSIASAAASGGGVEESGGGDTGAVGAPSNDAVVEIEDEVLPLDTEAAVADLERNFRASTTPGGGAGIRPSESRETFLTISGRNQTTPTPSSSAVPPQFAFAGSRTMEREKETSGLLSPMRATAASLAVARALTPAPTTPQRMGDSALFESRQAIDLLVRGASNSASTVSGSRATGWVTTPTHATGTGSRATGWASTPTHGGEGRHFGGRSPSREDLQGAVAALSPLRRVVSIGGAGPGGSTTPLSRQGVDMLLGAATAINELDRSGTLSSSPVRPLRGREREQQGYIDNDVPLRRPSNRASPAPPTYASQFSPSRSPKRR